MRTRPGHRARRAAAILLALPAMLLSGCDDPAIERGTPPAIALQQDRAEVPLYRFGAARLLRQQIAALAPDGQTRALDASIHTTSLSQRNATRSVLIQMGLDPARIAWLAQPGDLVVLTRTLAVTRPCGAALRSDWQGDVGNSITSLGTCVQANNLAEMVSDPRDLARPVELGPTNGAVAARAVRDWENGAARQPSARSPAGAEGGGADADAGTGAGGGDAGGSIPAGPAAGAGLGPQSSSAPAASGTALNPLLAPPPAPNLFNDD